MNRQGRDNENSLLLHRERYGQARDGGFVRSATRIITFHAIIDYISLPCFFLKK